MATLDVVLIALLSALFVVGGLLYFYWLDVAQPSVKARDIAADTIRTQARALELITEAYDRQHEELTWTRLKYAQEKLGADLITPADLEAHS